MQTALEQFEHLLEQMHAAVKDPNRFNQASEELHTLVSAHLAPEIECFIGGGKFTGREKQIMLFLKNRMARVSTKIAIFDSIYFDYGGNEPDMKIIDIYVCRIRKKLEAVHSDYTIETIWGEGYRLINKSEQAKAA